MFQKHSKGKMFGFGVFVTPHIFGVYVTPHIIYGNLLVQ